MANRDQFNRGIILPTLIRQLKRIQEQYPDDGQILKELIQNAEDARASKIVFLLDSTSYSARPGKLHNDGLAAYQGPALCVYNDAMFTPDDWTGITMLSESVKEHDPMKVGRFGLGFKSVFHMTDLPYIFSGNGIGLLDPHQTFFGTSAHLWDLKKDKSEIEQLEDQFEPFRQNLFGVEQETFERGSYEGTMFRFPLRMEGMKSELSDTKYSLEKVRELFRSLEKDAHIILLFLKSLECIEVYEKTSTKTSPVRILSINIRLGSAPSGALGPSTSKKRRKNVQNERLQLTEAIKKQEQADIPSSVSSKYFLEVELSSLENLDVSKKPKKNKPTTKTEISQWIISHYYAGRSELESVNEVKRDLGLLPWVGAALEVTNQRKLNPENASYLAKPNGHLFCFLPLPLEEESLTGLRVHVHGYFAVDSNRRHIKWPTADQNPEKLTDKALIWNEFLVNTLTAKAMVNLALHIADPDNNLSHELIFDVMPDKVTPQWKQMADRFYEELPHHNIFYSLTSGNLFNCGNVLFDNIEDKSTIQKLIRKILMQNRVDFASAPSFLKRHFTNSISPIIVCQAYKEIQSILPLDEEQRFLLLDYFLANFPNGMELIGIKLVPLENEEWTEFQQSDEEKVYIESSEHPRAILPSLDRLFLRQNTSIFERMRNLALENTTQLVLLDPQSVATLLPLIFPEHWNGLNEACLDDAPYLSLEWLNELWTYMTHHFSHDLKPFENFLILPIGEKQVTRLKNEIPIILSNHHGTRFDEDVKSVLRKLGLSVIDELPAYVLGHQNLVGNYVLPNNANSVLSVMNELFQQKNLAVSSLNDSEKKLLQKFMASGLAGEQPLISKYRNLLLFLPIFKTVEGSGFKSSEFVSINSVSQGTQPDVDLPVCLPSLFIDMRENLVRDLAVKLGVVQKSMVEILELWVFPAINEDRYESEDIKKLMAFVCDNFSHFCSESHEDFCLSATNVRFIEKQNRNGVLVTPRKVFDNSDQTLCVLFTDDDVFPVDEFAKPKYAPVLRQIGIKGQNSVTAADLLAIASKLNSAKKPDISRAQTFLTFLECHHHLLKDEVVDPQNKNLKCTLLNALLNLKWIKPESCRPDRYPKSLKFVGETHSKNLLLPSDVSSKEFNTVIGSVRPTVDVEKTPNVAACFNWRNRPSTDEVVQHLLNVISSYPNQQVNKYQFIAKAIYKFLNENIAKSDHGVRLSELIDRHWIWTGDTFVSANKVVKRKPFMDLRPHVYQLPSYLEDLPHLWNVFKIEENVDLVNILKEIHLLHTNGTCDTSQTEQDVHITVAILNKISKMENKYDVLSELLVPIQTKDDKLCMKPIQDVTYCDKEWNQQGYDDQDIFLVHQLLPPETAEALNIHSVIHRVLGAEELDVGFESYGQSEPLTRRLNSILKDYTDGMAVLKELIQNADDAGATEVKFLYDQRRNDDSKTSLFDKEMAGLQGPALWAYNDAIFTRQDFDNLVKLSGATKEENKDKIGRFGLGFNAVYNLTDVPSLISQNYVVFLDPHTKYLGRAIRDRNKPGIKLDVGCSQKRLQLLKDQFKPYNGVFNCDLGKEIAANSKEFGKWSYEGTLFRFPLRTAKQAEESEICHRNYSHQEMMILLELLNKSGHSLLLFTQSVRKITVFHISEKATPDGIEEWFVIEKSLEETVRSLSSNSLHRMSEISELARQSSILKVSSGILGSTANDSVEPPEIESSMIIKVLAKNSVKFANLLKLKAGVSNSHWLISSCMGRKDSFAMANRCKDLTPVGGVAARLQRIKKTYEPVNVKSTKVTSEDAAMVFCFLPLPIKSSFPVHINGSFALTSSRTHIYETTVADKLDHRSQWNEVLIKDAITQAYINLLEDLLKVCQSPSCSFYALWLVHESVKGGAGCFTLLTEALYERIFCTGLTNQIVYSHHFYCTDPSDNAPKVVIENGQLLSMAECRYLEPNFRHGTVGKAAQTVLKSMDSLDFYVTDIPKEVYDTAKQTSASNQLEVRKIGKREFYEQFFLSQIENVNAKQRDTLILHALFDQNLIELLRSVACIPVKP